MLMQIRKRAMSIQKWKDAGGGEPKRKREDSRGVSSSCSRVALNDQDQPIKQALSSLHHVWTASGDCIYPFILELELQQLLSFRSLWSSPLLRSFTSCSNPLRRLLSRSERPQPLHPNPLSSARLLLQQPPPPSALPSSSNPPLLPSLANLNSSSNLQPLSSASQLSHHQLQHQQEACLEAEGECSELPNQRLLPLRREEACLEEGEDSGNLSSSNSSSSNQRRVSSSNHRAESGPRQSSQSCLRRRRRSWRVSSELNVSLSSCLERARLAAGDGEPDE